MNSCSGRNIKWKSEANRSNVNSNGNMSHERSPFSTSPTREISHCLDYSQQQDTRPVLFLTCVLTAHTRHDTTNLHDFYDQRTTFWPICGAWRTEDLRKWDKLPSCRRNADILFCLTRYVLLFLLFCQILPLTFSYLYTLSVLMGLLSSWIVSTTSFFLFFFIRLDGALLPLLTFSSFYLWANLLPPALKWACLVLSCKLICSYKKSWLCSISHILLADLSLTSCYNKPLSLFSLIIFRYFLYVSLSALCVHIS